jgi:glycosyltransferase 2 family protein
MKKYLDYIWPVIGLGAILFSFSLLLNELKGISAQDVFDELTAIPFNSYAMAGASTLLAYTALAWYDRIALMHLGKKLSWLFISLTSFTTYALSHNIGMSVFSGAMVRFRAYSSKGLTLAEITILVAFCSLTFALGTLTLSAIVLILHPEIIQRLFAVDLWIAHSAGIAIALFIILYGIGSILHFKPLHIGNFELIYPRPTIALRQIIAGCIEIIGAAGIIYFTLPPEFNPGYIIVLGVFLASFSAALLSHAPGGLGVLEFVFIKAMPDTPHIHVLAALLIFRFFYLLIPLAAGIVVVIAFERQRLMEALRKHHIPLSL